MKSNLRISMSLLMLAATTGCSISSGKKPAMERSDLFSSASVPAPAVSPMPMIHNGAIYQPHNNRLLFNDLKARRPGDLITVILDENTVAAKSASTRSSKDSSIDLAAPTLLGTTLTRNGKPISTNLESGNAFSGSGDSNQSNSLNGNITVTVISVTDGGNLVIRGEKLLTLNSGREVIKISGIVRPTDITPDNTIVSTLIADAKIVYSGQGLIADSNRAGWFTRFVNGKFWPF